mgnify:CR=1 FL=1
MNFVVKLQEIKLKEQANGATMFLGTPDRWYDNPHFRCENNHVSARYLKSEEKGDLCLACFKPVYMTFPEDIEGIRLV